MNHNPQPIWIVCITRGGKNTVQKWEGGHKIGLVEFSSAVCDVGTNENHPHFCYIQIFATDESRTNGRKKKNVNSYRSTNAWRIFTYQSDRILTASIQLTIDKVLILRFYHYHIVNEMCDWLFKALLQLVSICVWNCVN